MNNTTTGSLNYGNTGLPVIAAKDNLTILGNGDTIERSTATGTPDFRLLRVASGGSLTLENLTLQGGMIEGDGLRNQVCSCMGAGGRRRHLHPGHAGPEWRDRSGQRGRVQGSTGSSTSRIAAAGGGIFSSGGSVTLEGGTIVQNNEALGSNAPARVAGATLTAAGCLPAAVRSP